MLREEEKQVAEIFEAALRSGKIRPMPAYPNASWEQGSDPPDLILRLDSDSVPISVELTTVLDHTGEFQQEMAAAERFSRRNVERVDEHTRI